MQISPSHKVDLDDTQIHWPGSSAKVSEFLILYNLFKSVDSKGRPLIYIRFHKYIFYNNILKRGSVALPAHHIHKRK